jgi:hypothetical protein
MVTLIVYVAAAFGFYQHWDADLVEHGRWDRPLLVLQASVWFGIVLVMVLFAAISGAARAGGAVQRWLTS